MAMMSTHPDYASLKQAAEAAGQGHIFRHWHQLNEHSRRRLLSQVSTIDFAQLSKIYTELLRKRRTGGSQMSLEPAEVISLSHQRSHPGECAAMSEAGAELLRRGKVAAILVAGGQGSRLGFEGPKGIYTFGTPSGKSLFQVHAEKIRAMARRYGAAIPWYIMTSEANHAATQAFFRENEYFGLPPSDVFFFQQGMMPAIDAEGRIILDAPDHIFMNPDGHGGTLAALGKSGALADMRRRGLEQLFYFQIDNVLIKMCDPLFLGYHAAAGAEMSAKVCSKRDPHEKIGVIGRRHGRLTVIEYSDMSAADKEMRNPDGTLKYNSGSIAIHVLQVDFVARLIESGTALPWHVAHKTIPFINQAGKLIRPTQPNGYKFETFIFDALGEARGSVVLEVERRQEFSPIKNASGVDSPETARRDFYNFYGEWLEQCGVTVPRDRDGNVRARIEISPLFALDAAELAQKIRPDFKVGEEVYLR
ncbi:MAG: UDPGP type 1 family protein [candidate division KSB1 bacterium]|nr:UDPGP type 1 family protein [candidate division KSB1 bacterium]MDZ7274839.1 UDPGP type 1 family protein [candidate division KSB1 bacterium]MDZ7288206.1 UDPGP type 1 family protein [candidate division KSB1 bacterium]MDZ7300413.1 UDPGP type 1 family protein [candidate division KSB1 bacterium]MDZ7308132.1 UDPGP type 1 family protein [candidate division KSB1 bacterium]